MADRKQRELDAIKRGVETLAELYRIKLQPMDDEASILSESARVLPMVKERQDRRNTGR